MFGKLKQKIKNKNQKGEETQSITPKKKNKNTRLHIIYVLIIINLIIWTITCVRMNNFYQSYVDLLVNNAQAQERQVEKNVNNHSFSQKGNKKKSKEELSMREYVFQTVKEANINPMQVDCLISNESNWNTNAKNINLSNNNVDLGLYQWSTKYQIKPGYISMECIGNYKCETKKFIEKVKKDKNFSAWHAYTKNCMWMGNNPFIK